MGFMHLVLYATKKLRHFCTLGKKLLSQMANRESFVLLDKFLLTKSEALLRQLSMLNDGPFIRFALIDNFSVLIQRGISKSQYTRSVRIFNKIPQVIVSAGLLSLSVECP